MMQVHEKSILGGSGEQGFNLVELMIGVLVIAISVLALYEMFINGTSMIEEETHRRFGLENAASRMEKLAYYRTFCDTVPRSESGVYTEILYPPSPGEEPIEAKCHVDVQHSVEKQADGTPLSSDVTIKYVWQEKSGHEQEIVLRAKI
jgi:prepilin-type N-terminal cleavage/methylation domain-containing protein